jgi:tetratricopeptide (TPR) repeat protein
MPSFVQVLLAVVPLGGSALAQSPAPAKPPAASGAPKAAAEPALPFEEVARRAAAARDDAPDEALRWYRRGVRMRPTWDEGWWYLGSLSYSADRYADARDAFGRFVALKPDAGPAWALRGLSEFQLKEYDQAERHLSKAMSLGTVGNTEIRKVVYYHFALLRIRAGQFELAVDPLQKLAQGGEPETPDLLDACGLVALREARLPAELAPEKRDLARAAGAAVYAGLAGKTDEMRSRFDTLLRLHPSVPNLHYTYGLFLKEVDVEKAIASQRREMELQPEAVLPALEMAFAYQGNGRYDQALPWAEAAAKRAPGLFAAHYALGRALVELGQVERGLRELEEAARLAPESPEVHFALARAYSAAGRAEDSERERNTFRKLVAERKEVPGVPGFARDLTSSAVKP